MSTPGWRDWVSHAITKVVLLSAIVILVTLMSAPIYSQPCGSTEDCWAPDSAYFLPFSFKPMSCYDSVEAHLPVHLWTDGYATAYTCYFRILDGARFDTADVFFIHQCTSPDPRVYILDEGKDCNLGAICWTYMTPASGIVFELVLHCSKADTVKITTAAPWHFELTDLFTDWTPLAMRLDTSFVVPTEFPTQSGDVNCSQSVSISDAVFLINYIFAGGCAPCNSNAADVNGNCAISISDVVYLINYIFAGGNAPLPGCVVP
jgi:hypothetical protein